MKKQKLVLSLGAIFLVTFLVLAGCGNKEKEEQQLQQTGDQSQIQNQVEEQKEPEFPDPGEGEMADEIRGIDELILEPEAEGYDEKNLREEVIEEEPVLE